MTETGAKKSDVALVCIDVQRDFVPPPTADGSEAEPVQRIRELVATARENDVPVIFVRELHNPSLVDLGREVDGVEGLHCIEGTTGADFVEGFGPRPDEYQIRKRRYSAFFGTDLDIVLRGYGVNTIVLTGGLTDVCVHYTAVDAHQHDYHVRVVEDAVFASSPPAHEAALAAMKYLQINAVLDSDDAGALIRARATGTQPAIAAATPV
ncbi:cysteine hydrolase [Nocardioides immobilis]|uniref:Cysteine hydrolase n=2 Tax=Nocardioides immobilis TaxID=2049295 RepID=A0A417XS68_9ACTN|nr:cysteine hydrolase [Nocardioides immobilis]